MSLRQLRRQRIVTDVLMALLIAASIAFAWAMRGDWWFSAMAICLAGWLTWMAIFLHRDAVGYERRLRERVAANQPSRRTGKPSEFYRATMRPSSDGAA